MFGNGKVSTNCINIMVNIQAYRCRHMRVEMMIVYDFTYHFPMFSAIEIILTITALEIK